MKDVLCCFIVCRYGDYVRKFKPGGTVARIVNEESIQGSAGDQPIVALDGRLHMLNGMCLAFTPDERYLYIADNGNRRIRRVWCPNVP